MRANNVFNAPGSFDGPVGIAAPEPYHKTATADPEGGMKWGSTPSGPVTGGSNPAEVSTAGARSGLGRLQKAGIQLPGQTGQTSTGPIGSAGTPVAKPGSAAQNRPTGRNRNIPMRAPRGRKGYQP